MASPGADAVALAAVDDDEEDGEDEDAASSDPEVDGLLLHLTVVEVMRV